LRLLGRPRRIERLTHLLGLVARPALDRGIECLAGALLDRRSGLGLSQAGGEAFDLGGMLGGARRFTGRLDACLLCTLRRGRLELGGEPCLLVPAVASASASDSTRAPSWRSRSSSAESRAFSAARVARAASVRRVTSSASRRLCCPSE
jgi:hypothetical protein